MSFFRKKSSKLISTVTYDRGKYVPIIKASICNGEQVACLKDIRTGKLEEIMLIRAQTDLMRFKEMYGIEGDVEKEY